MEKKKVYSPQEIADYFSVSRQAIYNWTKEGMPKEFNSPPRYDLDKVIEWAKRRGK